MGNLKLGRPHRGLGVVIGMHILLNISLVGCRGKLTVLMFSLGLIGRHFFKLNLGLNNTKNIFWQLEVVYRYRSRCFLRITFTKKPKNHVHNNITPKIQSNCNIHL